MSETSGPSLTRERMANWSSHGIVVLVLGVALYRVTQTTADPDIWGHLQFGLDTWWTGTITQIDPYSYLTEGQRWINHEWLAEVSIALAYLALGPVGLVVLKGVILLFIPVLVFHHLTRQGLHILRASMVVLVVTLMVLPGGAVRPQLFTYLFFLLLIVLLHAAEHGQLRWLWGVPPVMALWVNFHGGVLAGLAVWLVWCAVRLTFATGWRERLTLVPVGIISLLAPLLNPYGLELPIFLLRTGTVSRPEINEWQPMQLISGQGALYLLLLAVTSAAWISSQRPRRPGLLAVFACTAVMPLLAVRHGPLFALAAAVLTAEHLATVWCRGPLGGDSGRRQAEKFSFLIGAVCFLAGAAFIVSGFYQARCIRLDPHTGFRFPSRAVALLKASGISANLAILFDWGEYAIWHLAPQKIRVSVDGRRETVYSDEIYRENLRFLYGLGDWDSLVDRRSTHLVLISRDFPVFNLMKLITGWQLLYADSLSGLFVRHGSPLADAIQQVQTPDLPDDGAGLCFP